MIYIYATRRLMSNRFEEWGSKSPWTTTLNAEFAEASYLYFNDHTRIEDVR